MSRGECGFCVSGGCCGAIKPSVSLYRCTREKDHEGEHVECGLFVHEIGSWPQKEEDEK